MWNQITAARLVLRAGWLESINGHILCASKLYAYSAPDIQLIPENRLPKCSIKYNQIFRKVGTWTIWIVGKKEENGIKKG